MIACNCASHSFNESAYIVPIVIVGWLEVMVSYKELNGHMDGQWHNFGCYIKRMQFWVKLLVL